jgi:hypothetical protein
MTITQHLHTYDFQTSHFSFGEIFMNTFPTLVSPDWLSCCVSLLLLCLTFTTSVKLHWHIIWHWLIKLVLFLISRQRRPSALQGEFKGTNFNYIVRSEGSFYVNRPILCVCGLSYSLSCHCRVLNHLQRQDAWAKHTSLYLVLDELATSPFLWHVWNLYQYPRAKDHGQKLWEHFSQKYICCTNSNSGKLLWQRNQYSIECTCTMYGRNRVCRMGYALFSSHDVARVQGYLRKSEGSLPVESNYVVNRLGVTVPYMEPLYFWASCKCRHFYKKSALKDLDS